MVIAPQGVYQDGVETGGFDLLKNIFPKLWNRYAPVVKLSRPDEQAFAIDLEAIMIPLNYFVQSVVMEWPSLRL